MRVLGAFRSDPEEAPEAEAVERVLCASFVAEVALMVSSGIVIRIGYLLLLPQDLLKTLGGPSPDWRHSNSNTLLHP